MGLMRKRIRPGRPGRRAEAATAALCWIVTDKPGEWLHGPLIDELTDLGYSKATAGAAIRDLKDAGLIRAEIAERRAHRLFATLEGRACYYGLAAS